MKDNNLQKNTIFTFAVLYAILAIASLLFNNFIDDPESKLAIGLGIFSLVTFVFIPIWAIKHFKSKGGFVSLGKAIKIGVLLGLLGGLIAGVYAMIYYQFINPDGIEHQLELSRKSAEKLLSNATPEEIDRQIEVTRKIFIPMQLIGQLGVGLLYGVIGGVIGGLIYKNPTDNY